MRVGTGFDVHPFVPDRPLILGGVRIPFDRGLAGHSDADALIHAICDACLGAAGLGDIGRLFPDTDPSHADRDSREFLRAVRDRLTAETYAVVNVDATLILQQPRIAPYVAQMETNISSDLSIDRKDVNIKATTTENLGFPGRGEGVAAQAVVLIEQTHSPR
jgi:2-C-methyl-D-erythritol 2,4-cyclodiphosphate synthase